MRCVKEMCLMIMNGQDGLQVIRNYFLKGTINEIWQQIEPDKIVLFCVSEFQ